MRALRAPMLQVKLPQLHTVDLSRNDRLTDITAEHLSKCAQLQHVKLEATNLTDAAVEHLAKCPLLRIASFEECVALTREAAVHLNDFPQLQEVNLTNIWPSDVVDGIADALATCTQLKTIRPKTLADTVAKKVANLQAAVSKLLRRQHGAGRSHL